MLVEPPALATRRKGLLADLVRCAKTHEELDSGHRLTFAATDETLAIILKMVTSERQCCQFLRFQITVQPGDGPISLELTGPHGTKEFLSALVGGHTTVQSEP